jgi:1-phosphofructokinase
VSKIITVTLNPSLDRTLFVHHLAEGYRNTVSEQTRLDPGGRGVNISRALHSMAVDTHAFVMIGTDATAKAYEALITAEPMPTTLLRREGVTRSNITIYDTGNHHETKIIEESHNYTDDKDDVTFIERDLLEIYEEGDTVCFSGAMPHGIPVDTYANLIRLIKERGGKTVLAADGIALEIGLKAKPNIVVVRTTELEAYFNYPVRNTEDIIYSAKKMSQRSGGNLVLVREEHIDYGLILNDTNGWIAHMPPIDEERTGGTTGGVKDAFVAGFLAHYRNSDDMIYALKWAMSSATYTRYQPGNNFGKSDQIEPHMKSVAIQEVD